MDFASIFGPILAEFHVFFITFRVSILDDLLMDFFHFFDRPLDRRTFGEVHSTQ